MIAALRQLVIARGTFLEAEEDHVDFLEIQLGFDPQNQHRRRQHGLHAKGDTAIYAKR